MLPSRLFGGFRPTWRLAKIPSRSLYIVQTRRRLSMGTFRANSFATSFTNAKDEPAAQEVQSNPSEPRLAIAFTCTADGCNHRSAHTFTKRSYERGIVIIQCPSCKNRHLIADNLGWFKDDTEDGRLKNIEDILRARGEHVQKGTLDVNETIEVSDS